MKLMDERYPTSKTGKTTLNGDKKANDKGNVAKDASMQMNESARTNEIQLTSRLNSKYSHKSDTIDWIDMGTQCLTMNEAGIDVSNRG